jgi:CPA1 family monovalent cation:H+ antiporter
MQFVVLCVGGVAIGLVAGVIIVQVRQRLRDPAVENVISLLSPYLAYLPAEWLHVSGVLAVVTAGIYISRRLGRITTAQVRLRLYAVWEVIIFLLNGLIFILMGLQVSRIMARVESGSAVQQLGRPLIVCSVAIVARIVWVIAAAYGSRRLGTKAFRERNPDPPLQQVLLVGWTQMRGVVSLAAALALPLATMTDSAFPDRDRIIFMTFVVILVTLVLQGLTLPIVIRALRIETGTDESADEEITARYLAALAAIERLDRLGASDNSAAAALKRLRANYDDQIAYYISRMSPDGRTEVVQCDNAEQVSRQAIDAQREMLLRLRDQGVIGDDVLRLVEHDLDLEESRL